uniref:Fibronectin type III domain-containing protein n=1 Tax=Candidatus Kentrum sp. FW TaxID=2126338 RepID=A0A450TX70_9GAMM|nr:MAG: hypothetical protein BECKFW1821C_GA0114237_105513 [Candidatus Kentron sp. FW]
MAMGFIGNIPVCFQIGQMRTHPAGFPIMTNLPRAESKIQSLAHEIVAGLQTHTDLYPSPPISAEDLDKALAAYTTALDAATDLQAQAEHATATKDEALQTLVDDMKMILRYAENVTHFDDASLKFLGWGGRHARTSLQAPGQTRSLEAPRQGEGWIFLDWKQPDDGGKVAAYKVRRREEGSENWMDGQARPWKRRSPSPASPAASASSSM